MRIILYGESKYCKHNRGGEETHYPAQQMDDSQGFHVNTITEPMLLEQVQAH